MNEQKLDAQKKAFYTYADALKMSAVVAVVEQFSTREDVPTMLKKVFRTIGIELNELLQADEVYHLFLNPDLKEAHRLDCKKEDGGYQRFNADITVIDLYRDNPNTWFYYVDSNIDKNALIAQKQPFLKQLYRLIDNPPFYSLAPFCWRDYPLGFFIFVWRDVNNSPPQLFKKEEVQLRESAISILAYLQELVTKLFTNHYPMYRDTYLPKYMEVIPRQVAVLFADIRNFTSAFEAIRLQAPKGNMSNPLVSLIKSYLCAASDIIATPGIGRIDKFIGDGIMALFGEYLICKNDPDSRVKDTVSCLLALYTSAMLSDAFEKLFKYFLNIKEIKDFLLDYTEEFTLKIGCGINFGEVHFDYFGTSIAPNQESSRLIGGYLEYTAVGDHVNTAQRIEGIANKPISSVNLIERSKYRSERSQSYTAPIIVSRPVFLRIKDWLKDPPGSLSIADYYKATAMLKGKGSVIDIFEIYPDEIKGKELLSELKRVGLDPLENSISAFWDNNAKRFNFSDVEAKRLIELYCI
jgi:class 3 adenylate cyclase